MRLVHGASGRRGARASIGDVDVFICYRLDRDTPYIDRYVDKGGTNPVAWNREATVDWRADRAAW